MTASLFEIEGLRYLDRGPVDLVVEPGVCVSVTGVSGSGKTLLLRALADLDPHEGRVCLGGRPCAEMPAPEWRCRVGMLPAESAWWADTVAPHFPADLSGDALVAYGFEPDALTWSVQRLSTGERQRLGIARLLARAPEALLLDEPTASLDPDNVERMEGLLSQYRVERAAPVLWVSHAPDQAERVATRHFTLRDGRLVEGR